MTTVKDVLDSKGYGAETIEPERTVFEAIHIMARHEIGSVVVTRGEQVIGLLTERDYLKIGLLGLTSRTARVGDIMSGPIVSVGLDASVDECLSIMTETRSRQIPVVEGGRLTGVVSIGDLVKWRLAQQDREIDALVRYIQTGAALWAVPPGSAAAGPRSRRGGAHG